MFNTSQMDANKRKIFVRKSLHILGGILTLGAIFFLIHQLWQHASELRKIELGAEALLSIAGGILFYIGSMGISAYILKFLLQIGGELIPFRQAWMIFGIAQIGKYLPGNMFHYVLQVMIGQRLGISARKIVISMGVNTVILGGSAALLACFELFTNRRIVAWVIANQHYARPGVVVFITIGGFVLLFLGIVFVRRKQEWVQKGRVYLHPRGILLPVLLYMIVFIGYGMLHVILLRYVFRLNTGITWYQFTLGFSVAWLLGFITPGAPGGIGIRETMFFLLFESVLDQGVIIQLALVLRGITCLGDLIAFGTAYGVMKYLSLK